MLKVIPLRYGTMFKKAFGDPEVFSRFASDVLGMPIEITTVHQEFSYPEAVGHVKVAYDLYGEDVTHRVIVEVQHIREKDFFDRFLHYHLVSLVEQAESHEKYRLTRDVFTLVLLTTEPKDKEMRFSVAVSDMDPISEQGTRLGVYRHRLVFLNPRVINDRTPPGARRWMELIADSLDGEVDETHYTDPMMQRALRSAVLQRVNPEELARIKDEAVWQEVKQDAFTEGEAQGEARGEARGEVKSARATLLRLLSRRGLAVADEHRARIETCDDPVTLDAWIDRAIDATTVSDVLR